MAINEFKIFLFFYITSVLLPHTDPSSLPHVCLAISPLGILIHSGQRVYIVIHAWLP